MTSRVPVRFDIWGNFYALQKCGGGTAELAGPAWWHHLKSSQSDQFKLSQNSTQKVTLIKQRASAPVKSYRIAQSTDFNSLGSVLIKKKKEFGHKNCNAWGEDCHSSLCYLFFCGGSRGSSFHGDSPVCIVGPALPIRRQQKAVHFHITICNYRPPTLC